jgi:hypothetical protein
VQAEWAGLRLPRRTAGAREACCAQPPTRPRRVTARYPALESITVQERPLRLRAAGPRAGGQRCCATPNLGACAGKRLEQRVPSWAILGSNQ